MNNPARISISSTYSIIYRKRKCFAKVNAPSLHINPRSSVLSLLIERCTSDCSDMIRFSNLWNKIDKLCFSLRLLCFHSKNEHCIFFIHHNDISKSQHFFIMWFRLLIPIFSPKRCTIVAIKTTVPPLSFTAFAKDFI